LKLSTDERQHAQILSSSSRREQHLLGRIQLEGMESLSDAEQVEFHLYYYRPKRGVDARALAERMVEKFGGLANLALLTAKELMTVEGMYPALARRFTGYGRLLRQWREYERRYRRIYIRGIVDLCRHVLPLYRVSKYPGTWQLCLSEDYELIYQREIAPSLGWGEEDCVAESLQDADFTGAKYVIIVMMYGRVPASPKLYDKQHARLHAQRLAEMNKVLLDVVMVDEGRLTSMYELGMIKPEGKKAADRRNYPASGNDDRELRIDK